MKVRARKSIAISALLVGTVWVNALWLQEGRHPAPLFAVPAQLPAVLSAQGPATASGGAANIATAAADPAPSANKSPPLRGEQLASLQRALFDMGFYDGAIDGLDGPRTHYAVMSYRKAHGLAPVAVADEALLAHARKSNGDGPAVRRPQPLSAEQRRVRAVQMVLVNLGYAPGAVSGQLDGDTRRAIERFQRDRGLPVTGEMTAPLVRELSAASGIPLEENSAG